MAMSIDEILETMRANADADNVAGMARFGISSEGTLGLSIPFVRSLAKRAGRDHELALALWATGIHEARILASMVDRPGWVTEAQMEAWVVQFDSWDVCDQVCGNLFNRAPLGREKAVAWCHRPEEFVRRAGFVLMAYLAVHDKRAADELFVSFFPLIREYAVDERNFVKKAVNWALRQIGKRNGTLMPQALALAEELSVSTSRSARWIGKDAARELRSKQAVLKPSDASTV